MFRLKSGFCIISNFVPCETRIREDALSKFHMHGLDIIVGLFHFASHDEFVEVGKWFDRQRVDAHVFHAKLHSLFDR